MTPQEVQAQAMLWVLREEKRSDLDITTLNNYWIEHRLDELPPGLAYLMLECGQVVGYRIADGWLYNAVSCSGLDPFCLVRGRLSPQDVLVVSKRVLELRRRRERVSPSWQREYQKFTNRVNRVQGRVLQLVHEQIRSEFGNTNASAA